jgi:membrane-bound metal-dependent hydrolase YbcI (DUF457 family)
MLAGHYSAAFLAKTAAPRTPLWVLALAVQLVDVLWAGFVLMGIERLRLDPTLPSNPLVLEHMPYTHSLLGTLLWAGVAGFAGWRVLGSAAAAWAVSAAVASHWLLDVIVHRPDMTLWGAEPKLGLGIWNHPAAALALELGLLIGAAGVCLRSGSISASRRRAVLAGVAVLAVLQLATTLAPPALGPSGVAWTALLTFGLVAFGARRLEG